MMPGKLKLIFILFLLCPFQGRADGPCEVKDVPGITGSRTKSIQLTDGREIIIVGETHGNASNKFQQENLLKDTPNTSSPSVLGERLAEILETENEAVQHQNENLIFLKTLFSQRSDLKFLGVEYPQTALASHLQKVKQLQNTLNGHIKKGDLSLSPTARNTILFYAGAPSYIQVFAPEIMKGRKLIGLEDETETKEMWNAMLARMDLSRKISDPAILGAKIENSKYIEAQYLTYVPGQQDKQIIDQIKNSVPAEYQPLFSSWAQAQLREISAMKRREAAMIQGLLSQNKSGVFIVGILHLDSLMLQLKAKCIAEPGAGTNKMLTPALGVR